MPSGATFTQTVSVQVQVKGRGVGSRLTMPKVGNNSANLPLPSKLLTQILCSVFQRGVCRGFPVNPHIGAAELKERLFNGIKEEWTIVNNGHELEINKLQLSSSDLIEICPPKDGMEDVDCLARWLYKPSKKSNEVTLTIPKAPLQLLFTMNSKDFIAFNDYFEEMENDTVFQANLAMATGGEVLEASSEVRYIQYIASIL